MATPHNEAKPGDIASTVLMPGDPLRAKLIASNFLKDAVLFNGVRGMLGYTGYYNDKKVSVMGSGMGMPSIGIYSYELYKRYNVDNIIRIGSAGSYTENVHLMDLMMVDRAYSESTFALTQNGYKEHYTYPSEQLNNKILEAAKDIDIQLVNGTIHSTDVFYQDTKEDYFKELYANYGCLAVEMESFALFHNASVLNKNAACLVTISDSFVTDAKLTIEQRQNSFTDMINVALNTVSKYL